MLDPLFRQVYVRPVMVEFPPLKPKKHRHLTQEVFDQLLLSLHPNREQAAEKYEHVRQALITFFTFRGAVDPLDLADETINRVAGRLAEGQEIFTQNPKSYFYGVARNVWREVLARPQTTTPISDALSLDHHQLPDPHELLVQTEERQVFEQRLQALERCLQKLSGDDRELMMAYYQGTGSTKIENRQELAQRFRISHKTLRNKTSRLRRVLAECVRHGLGL